MDAVIQVDVGRPGRVIVHEALRAAPQERVARFVAEGRVCLRLHDNAPAMLPDQFTPDQINRTGERMAGEELAGQHPRKKAHSLPPRAVSGRTFRILPA